MRRFGFSQAILASAAILSPLHAFANDLYDRKLEQAVMAIAAKKVGDIRGPLTREFQPPTPFETLVEQPPSALIAAYGDGAKPVPGNVSVINLGQKGG